MSQGSSSQTRLLGDGRKVVVLEDVPNIGRAIAADLRLIGIQKPEQLVGQDPYAMFERLSTATGMRHDPCELDTFISAVRFMEGGPRLPWWAFTAERKRVFKR